jgi:aerobic-type carbon monoxide dehydrogenase small subunit (CoxS/CutS family)
MIENTGISLIVNGKSYHVAEKPGEMLSDLLRYRLGLTGTKIACNEAECGACTVILDGEPVLSCTYPAVKADGKTILTIEGLTNQFAVTLKQPDSAELHPLQKAFIQHGAVQCGFCIPGQIMTAYALLQRNPDPSEEEIKVALKDTLCR